MAKSLRSKRKRMLRRLKREKVKVIEDARLLETLGIVGPGKDAEMKSTSEDKKQTDGKQDEDHVQEPKMTNNPNTNEDVDMNQETKKTGTPRIKVDRKQLLKRLGKKKYLKNKNKKCKW